MFLSCDVFSSYIKSVINYRLQHIQKSLVFSPHTLALNVCCGAKKQEAQKHESNVCARACFFPIRLYCYASASSTSKQSTRVFRLSVGLLCPGQVVCSWLLPGDSLDQLLHPSPKAQLVQRIVTPTWDVRKRRFHSARWQTNVWGA